MTRNTHSCNFEDACYDRCDDEEDNSRHWSRLIPGQAGAPMRAPRLAPSRAPLPGCGDRTTGREGSDDPENAPARSPPIDRTRSGSSDTWGGVEGRTQTATAESASSQHLSSGSDCTRSTPAFVRKADPIHSSIVGINKPTRACASRASKLVEPRWCHVRFSCPPN